MDRNNPEKTNISAGIVRVQGGSFAYGGANAARMPDGKVCFVRGILPGEAAVVKITADKRSFARGVLQEILEASPERIAAGCPAFPECPGCSYLHCSYDDELAAKAEQLAGFILRKNLAPPESLLPPYPAPKRFGWRNKLTPVLTTDSSGETVAAFHGEDNISLLHLPPEGCLLAHPELRKLLQNTISTAQSGEKLLLRYTAKSGAVLVKKDTPPLTETLNGTDFQTAAAGFFQTNPAVAEELAKRCVEAVKSFHPEKVLELYCGTGVFSILSAAAIPECRFTGIELNPAAIAFARINAAACGVAGRCRFYAGDAARSVNRNPGADLVIVDPPRSGLDRKLAQTLAGYPAEGIIYISCGPDTLARDLEILTAGSWQVKQAGLLDMFPGTAHFESMVILTRKKSRK